MGIACRESGARPTGRGVGDRGELISALTAPPASRPSAVKYAAVRAGALVHYMPGLMHCRGPLKKETDTYYDSATTLLPYDHAMTGTQGGALARFKRFAEAMQTRRCACGSAPMHARGNARGEMTVCCEVCHIRERAAVRSPEAIRQREAARRQIDRAKAWR